MKRPNIKNIQHVVEWLESIDICLYGQNMDVECGFLYPSQMDYSWEDAIKRYNHVKNDTLEDIDEAMQRYQLGGS